ncbi:MAG TPA: hypothetical protein VFQ30_06215 [Ktedonobacteraceae bacterium]|nr:hypothetical protein [Ktedonobacteraceae bacterium]
MAKPYDDSLKTLVRTNPQAFVSLVFPEAQYVRELPEKLKNLSLKMDALFEVVVKGSPILVHFEFQTYNDVTMPERLLNYNVQARRTYKKPVHSCAIHLLNDGELPASPLVWYSIPEEQVLEFKFQNIELSKLAPESLLDSDQAGLWPLSPLAKDGANYEVVDTMFSHLMEADKKDLLPIGYTLASLAFGENNIAAQDWLTRRYKEMYDVLRETPIYQEMTRTAREEGWEEGMEKGLERGLERGRLDSAHQTLVAVILERFPRLERFARKQLSDVDDPLVLQHLTVKMSIAQTMEEAKGYLLAIDDSE